MKKILRLIGNALEANNFHVETRKNIEEINICDFTGFDLIFTWRHDAYFWYRNLSFHSFTNYYSNSISNR